MMQHPATHESHDQGNEGNAQQLWPNHIQADLILARYDVELEEFDQALDGQKGQKTTHICDEHHNTPLSDKRQAASEGCCSVRVRRQNVHTIVASPALSDGACGGKDPVEYSGVYHSERIRAAGA